MKFIIWIGIAIVGILGFLVGAESFRLMAYGVGKVPVAAQVLVAPAILTGIIYLYRKNKQNP